MTSLLRELTPVPIASPARARGHPGILLSCRAIANRRPCPYDDCTDPFQA